MDAKSLKIVFMGTPQFAVESLRSLIDGGYNIVGVVTSVDKPAGRGLKIQESAVKEYAKRLNIPVLQPEKLRSEEFIEQLRTLQPDLGIVIAFRMLPEIVWSMPKLGTINLHASLLPNYRGAAPINWAIINGETKTGVTTFFLNDKIDCGAILAVEEIPITYVDTAGTLHDKLMEIGSRLVTESVEKLASRDYSAINQENTDPNTLRSAPKIFPKTCEIDWTQSANTIYNMVRGLSPYPAARGEMITDVDNPLMMKIYGCRAEICDTQIAVGSIVCDGKNRLSVRCGDGFVHIDDLQIAGSRRMSTLEFLRGFASKIGRYSFR